jgi:nitrogen fixation NifU-like protein
MPFSINLSNEMMREVIMDHYQHPRNRREASDESSYKTVYMSSDSCIDKIYIQIKVVNDVFEDVCWHGNGCAISTASTSIMTELLTGKSVKEGEYIIEQYMNMIEGKEYDGSVLDKAIVFMNTNRQPSRIKCATIGFRGVTELLGGKDHYE